MAPQEGSTMPGTSSAGITWDDCWIALGELEERVACSAVVRLWRPVANAGSGWSQARVAVTISLPSKGPEKPRTRFGYLGGAKGAKTMPGALMRAIQELHWSLDDDEAAVASQARLL